MRDLVAALKTMYGVIEILIRGSIMPIVGHNRLPYRDQFTCQWIYLLPAHSDKITKKIKSAAHCSAASESAAAGPIDQRSCRQWPMASDRDRWRKGARVLDVAKALERGVIAISKTPGFKVEMH